MQHRTLIPGLRVRVAQRIATRDGAWTTEVEGKVVSCGDRSTGSWFAQGKNDRLWLHRLRIERDDGELIDLTLDRHSTVTVLQSAESGL